MILLYLVNNIVLKLIFFSFLLFKVMAKYSGNKVILLSSDEEKIEVEVEVAELLGIVKNMLQGFKIYY